MLTKSGAIVASILLGGVVVAAPARSADPDGGRFTSPAPVDAPAAGAASVEEAARQALARQRWVSGLRLGSSLRTVLDDAARHPSAGGRLFRRQVGLLCHDVAAMHRPGAAVAQADVNHVNHGLSLQAGSALQRLCDAVDAGERVSTVLAAQDLNVDERTPGDDPYLHAYALLARAQSTAERRAATAFALRHFDPLYVNLLLKPVGTARWFDGRWYDAQSPDGRLLADALVLVACHFDRPCDRTDPVLAMACAADPDECGFASRPDRIRKAQADDGLSPEAFEETQRLALRVAAAIRERRLQALVAP